MRPAPRTVFVAVKGTVNERRSYWSLRASEGRHCNLIHHPAHPLLRVDATARAGCSRRLRAEGVVDIAAYSMPIPS